MDPYSYEYQPQWGYRSGEQGGDDGLYTGQEDEGLEYDHEAALEDKEPVTDDVHVEEEHLPLSWAEAKRSYEDGHATSALTFDTEEELLWGGYEDGRITSLTQPQGHRYTSILAHKGVEATQIEPRPPHLPPLAREGTRILGLLTCDAGVLSLSATSVRLHTRGCLRMACFEGSVGVRGVRGAPGVVVPIERLTSFAFNKPALAMGPGMDSVTHVTVACAGAEKQPPRLYQLDVYSGLTLAKSVDLPHGGGGTAMACGSMLAVGCEDGSVKLYDASLRTHRMESSYEPHAGPILGVAFTVSDGGYRIATIGQRSSSINPYDKNAPRTLHPDTVVKTFDLRMMRQCQPLPCGACVPTAITFLPTEDPAGDHDNDTIVVGTRSGQLMLSPIPYSATDVEHGWSECYQLADEDGVPEVVTSLACSSTGHIMAVGCASSAILQLTKRDMTEDLVHVNLESRDTEIPAYPAPPPPVSIDPMAPVQPPRPQRIAGRYIIRQTEAHLYTSGYLSSTLYEAPDLMEALLLKYMPPRILAPEVLSKVEKQELFPPNIKNPGCLPNSLIYSSGKDGAARNLYTVADPRKRVTGPWGGNAAAEKVNRAGGTWTSKRDNFSDIPKRYRRVEVQLGKGGYDGFDFGLFNTTTHAGLENGMPNCYANSVLQLLYHVPTVRAAALWEQYNTAAYACASTEGGLVCELGFLFSRIDTAKLSPPKGRSAQGTNFLLGLKQVPECSALGLLEDGAVVSTMSLPRRTEAFHRFILGRIHKELQRGRPDSAHAVDATYGHDICTVNTFYTTTSQYPFHHLKVPQTEQGSASQASKREESLPSSRNVPGAESSGPAEVGPKGSTSGEKKKTYARSYVTELQAPAAPSPSLGAKQAPNAPPAASGRWWGGSFSEILLQSLCRETKSQTWNEQLRQYAPIIQSRTPTSLPHILALHCTALVDIASGQSSPFRSNNPRGGSWLPELIEIRLPSGSSEESSKEANRAGVIVGERVDSPPGRYSGPDGGQEKWLFAGSGSSPPTSAETLERYHTTVRYRLLAVVSCVTDGTGPHLVLHVRDRMQGADFEVSEDNWVIFNDFLVEKTNIDDARGFRPWKEPVIILYEEDKTDSLSLELYQEPPPSLTVDPIVFHMPPVNKAHGTPLFPLAQLPTRGDVVALDAEFVALNVEEVAHRSDGSKVITKQGRQGLARVSAVDGAGRVLLDDYIVQTEPIVDYLTRFSGIKQSDLDPVTSHHNLVPLRLAYLKLRCLADRGVIFIGHGLAKDFRVMNLAVNKQQVADTSELWSQRGQRKASLRFLSHYILQQRIQGEVHDSIEDSRMALALYIKYKEYEAQGEEAVETALKELYKIGWKNEWKVRGSQSGNQGPTTLSPPPSNDSGMGRQSF